jgi:hypothetical protein
MGGLLILGIPVLPLFLFLQMLLKCGLLPPFLLPSSRLRPLAASFTPRVQSIMMDYRKREARFTRAYTFCNWTFGSNTPWTLFVGGNNAGLALAGTSG